MSASQIVRVGDLIQATLSPAYQGVSVKGGAYECIVSSWPRCLRLEARHQHGAGATAAMAAGAVVTAAMGVGAAAMGGGVAAGAGAMDAGVAAGVAMAAMRITPPIGAVSLLPLLHR